MSIWTHLAIEFVLLPWYHHVLIGMALGGALAVFVVFCAK